MKDLPHHIKKLNRNILRSVRREEVEELPELPTWQETPSSRRKKEKQQIKSARKARAPTGKTPDERNQEMKKGRTPVFDRNNAQPKHARSSKKKTPRI